ncbi:MAG TPA: hypothetical protein VKT49_03580 [Bryobacteraceae bacterium]|nr:hypothetical protein [Bryobacteraceae bacterium]
MIAFIAAEAREFEGLLRHVAGVRKLDSSLDFARAGKLCDKPVVLMANGPGPELAGKAADAAQELGGLEALISTGFCGALDPVLRVADVFVATEVRSSGATFAALEPAGRRAPHTGALISQNRVATTAEEKAELRLTGAAAVEMEAAGVAARAARWSVPFYAIRVVSDTAAETLPLDLNRMRDRQGRFGRARIVGAALLRPRLFPKLIDLQKRSAAASAALGDFLADVRF